VVGDSGTVAGPLSGGAGSPVRKVGGSVGTVGGEGSVGEGPGPSTEGACSNGSNSGVRSVGGAPGSVGASSEGTPGSAF